MHRISWIIVTLVLLSATWAIAKDQPKFKSIEVKHFPNAEGVELPPEFSDYLYAELRSTLEKKKLAADPSNEKARIQADQLATAQCIATDDPRLKEK